MESHFKEYRLDLATQAIYAFVWDEYCSWYVELSKVVLTSKDSNPRALRGTRRTLVRVLEAVLRLLHPITPFITEAIWQKVAPLAGKTGDSIMLQPYPQTQPEKIDPAAIEEMRWVMAVIAGVRNIRGEMDIAPAKALTALLQNGTEQDREYLQRNKHYLTGLARLDAVQWLAPGAEPPESAIALVGDMKVLLPLGSLINKQAELERLNKEMEKIQKDLSRAQSKLANADFIQRAPKTVVEQENRRVQEFEMALSNLNAQRRKVEALPS
jgi:valyl-tRNA synthetase